MINTFLQTKNNNDNLVKAYQTHQVSSWKQSNRWTKNCSFGVNHRHATWARSCPLLSFCQLWPSMCVKCCRLGQWWKRQKKLFAIYVSTFKTQSNDQKWNTKENYTLVLLPLSGNFHYSQHNSCYCYPSYLSYSPVYVTFSVKKRKKSETYANLPKFH